MAWRAFSSWALTSAFFFELGEQLVFYPALTFHGKARPGEHRGQQRPELADDAHAQQVDQVDVAAEVT